MDEVEDVKEFRDAGAAGEVFGGECDDEVASFSEGGCWLGCGIVGVPDVAEELISHAALECADKLPRRVARLAGHIERTALRVQIQDSVTNGVELSPLPDAGAIERILDALTDPRGGGGGVAGFHAEWMEHEGERAVEDGETNGFEEVGEH